MLPVVRGEAVLGVGGCVRQPGNVPLARRENGSFDLQQSLSYTASRPVRQLTAVGIASFSYGTPGC